MISPANDSPPRVEAGAHNDQDGRMPRIDRRTLVLVPVLLVAAACGDDETPPVVPPPSAAVSASSVPSGPAEPTAPNPSESVYVEEDPDPTAEAGDLSDEAQAYLDEALGIELGALESAAPATAAARRKTLETLPANPSQVLAALKKYEWVSPEAKARYAQAVAAK
jgi:hypothetical protein